MLLCPWNSLGKNTGVGGHFLLQGIFLIQGSNLGLPHCRQIVYCLSYQGSPNQLYLYIYPLRPRSPSHPPTHLPLWNSKNTLSPCYFTHSPNADVVPTACKMQWWVLRTAVDMPEVGSAPHGPTSREARQAYRKTERWSKSQPRLGVRQRRPLSGRQRCEPGRKETQVRSLDQEDSLEKEMAICFSILA